MAQKIAQANNFKAIIMNFIFISPNFPVTYWNFCDRLKKNGANVLGIGDEAYDNLNWNLKNSLTEYYKVNSLENYDEVKGALMFFQNKYGKIDWLESNNEYWLEQDARLRTEFGITTGVQNEGIQSFKSKAAMKPIYKAAGVPTARQCKVPCDASKDELKAFIAEVKYPVCVKPEIGVGAAATYKVSNDAELDNFLATRPQVPYVMEEFVFGDIYSYDAIINSKGEPVFESSSHFPPSVMDVVNDKKDMAYYVLDKVPAQLRTRGRATVKAFGVKSRFIHFEFFRLDHGKKGLGKKGDFVGLEVNMRPAGGYTPDMMDYAHSTDVYQIWADMVVFDERRLAPSGDDHFCIYYGRRDEHNYAHSKEEICSKYAGKIAMCERMPEVLSPAMGNQMFIVHAKDMAETEEFINFASQTI